MAKKISILWADEIMSKKSKAAARRVYNTVPAKLKEEVDMILREKGYEDIVNE